PDVRTDAVWLREEVERRAGEDASRWPRLLEPAEEWFLWRQCVAEVARPFALLNVGALAESLQRSSELAAQFRIPLGAQGEGSEGRSWLRPKSCAPKTPGRSSSGSPAGAGNGCSRERMRGSSSCCPARQARARGSRRSFVRRSIRRARSPAAALPRAWRSKGDSPSRSGR